MQTTLVKASPSFILEPLWSKTQCTNSGLMTGRINHLLAGDMLLSFKEKIKFKITALHFLHSKSHTVRGSLSTAVAKLKSIDTCWMQTLGFVRQKHTMTADLLWYIVLLVSTWFYPCWAKQEPLLNNYKLLCVLSFKDNFGALAKAMFSV